MLTMTEKVHLMAALEESQNRVLLPMIDIVKNRKSLVKIKGSVVSNILILNDRTLDRVMVRLIRTRTHPNFRVRKGLLQDQDRHRH